MDIFCVRIGVFCGYHSDPGKVRHKKNRFRHGDCGQDYSRADLCMDNGLDSRLGARHNSAQCKDVGVSCALGACDRGVMALLLQSAAGRTCQRRSTDRQAEHTCVDRVFVFRIQRAAVKESSCRPCADRRRNDDDARLTRITGSCGAALICLIEQPVVDAGFPGYDHYHEDDEVHECTGVACDDIGNCIDHTALHLTSGESVSREFEYFPYACEGR